MSRSKKTIKLGVIGCGYWGPNYVRIFNELTQSRVKYCCDLNKKNLEAMRKMFPGMKITRDYRKVAEDPDLDAACIVTSVNTHYEIVKYFLKNGKHVLVEKPFTTQISEARELIEIAKKKRLVLMVGHVYLYNPAIRELKRIIKKGKLGKIYYIKSERIGLGPIRKHASALWDLATHDISIALYLLEKSPIEIYAHGGSYIQKDIEDCVNLNLKFPNNIFCSIYASWFAPEKIRKLIVVGSKGMAVFDEMKKQEMLKIYERKVNKKLLNSTAKYTDHQNIVSMGNVYISKIKQREPLKDQAKSFLECILKNKKPLTDGKNGLEVIKILSSIDKKEPTI